MHNMGIDDMDEKNLFGEVPIINGDGILLRPIEQDDAESMLKIFDNDKLYVYRPGMARKNIPMINKMLKRFQQDYESKTGIYWAICLPGKRDEVIGTAEIFNVNSKIDAVEIGYSIGENYWGQGIATKVVGVLVKFLFEKIGVNRIEANTMVENMPSQKVLLKNKFYKEGIVRQGAFWNGKGIVDLIQFSILKEDYEGEEEKK